MVSMHSAMLKTIELSVLALQAIGQIQIHTQDVNNMNALVILNAQQTLHVQMRNVQIHASAQEMLIAQPEIIEEFVHASLATLEIPMELLVYQVRTLCKLRNMKILRPFPKLNLKCYIPFIRNLHKVKIRIHHSAKRVGR